MKLLADLDEPMRRSYLRGLQESFGDWGEDPDFAWWFDRKVDARHADLLAIEDSGRLTAGIAVSYRQMIDCGERSLAAVMTGAWTNERHRQHGCFGALVEQAKGQARERGARVMLGFASSGRLSRGTLERESDDERIAWTLTAEGGEATCPPALTPRPCSSELAAALDPQRRGAAFTYPTALNSQLRLGDPATEILDLGESQVAVVRSSSHGLDALLTLASTPGAASAAATGAALARLGKVAPLRAYTTETDVMIAATVGGLTATRASLFVTVLTKSPAPHEWSFQLCDKA